MNKLLYICVMEHFAAIRRNKAMISVLPKGRKARYKAECIAAIYLKRNIYTYAHIFIDYLWNHHKKLVTVVASV